ncbi:hypothetical protein CIPAW_03G077400 [Carya illinoinensis]|uniref:Uncharacterized protein n=1 Tax=Carya illinoinensis TaxID=32201 RepID=A0A8T1QY47_CARIL|nr:hypothetical protein CIPAW_03G077400 [Carya illinoinensis]
MIDFIYKFCMVSYTTCTLIPVLESQAIHLTAHCPYTKSIHNWTQNHLHIHLDTIHNIYIHNWTQTASTQSTMFIYTNYQYLCPQIGSPQHVWKLACTPAIKK